MNNKEYIRINRVTKNYKDPASGINFQALTGIDLTIDKGSFTSIIGPSGAGKTTLLNLIGGNIKPSTGTIFVKDLPIHILNDEELSNYRRYVAGFLWQDPEDNLISGLTVEENLVQAMRISGFPRNKRKEKINELLSNFGIVDRKDHRINQISGGEAIRASLAVSLVNEPELILADEPTGELDMQTSDQIISYLKKINKGLGITVVVVTHDRQFEPVSDRVYRLLDGTIVGMKGTRPSSLIHTPGEQDEDESIALVNALGQVQIPESIREKYHLTQFVRFVENEDDGSVTIIPLDKDNSNQN